MMKAAKGKWIVVFLDYDGTLSPIVNNPDRAFMSDEVNNKRLPTLVFSSFIWLVHLPNESLFITSRCEQL